MDEAFSLVAARMPRTRRITPFGVRMTAMLTVVGVLIAGFAAFVVDQQRAADRRRAATVATQQAEQHAQAQAVAALGVAIDDGTASPAAVGGLLNRQARDAAAQALTVAAQIAADSSYDDARPAALAAHDQGLLYVDGPSTAPSIVSVYNGAAGWAAAVRGAGDACYWVAVTPQGLTRYGTGSACTGMAALAADRTAW
jgi:hypothetical protein